MATKKGRLTTSLRSVITPRYLDTENILDVSGVDATGNNSALGWTIYKDSVSERPVDGTGGSPTIVQPVTVTTITPLSKGRSLLFQKNSGNAQGEGWSVDFRIDRVHLAKVLQIEFDYQIESGTFLAGTTNDYTIAGDSDLIVYIYDVDNNKLIEPTTFRLYSNSSNIADRFIGNFQTSADGLNYRLIFHVARNSTAAWTLKIDNVTVKPAKYTYGTPITDWVDFPSVAAGTLITATTTNPTYGNVIYNRAQWRRVGGEMEIRWIFKQTSAGTSGSGAYLFNLSPGYSIDLSKLDSNLANTTPIYWGNFRPAPIGSFYVTLGSSETTDHYHGVGYLAIHDSTRLKVAIQHTYPNGSSDARGWRNDFFAFGNNSLQIALHASVPIAGWSSSVKISEPMELRDVMCSVYRASSNQTGIPSNTNTKILFNAKSIDTTNSFDISTSRFTAPISGYYLVNAELHWESTSGDSFRVVRIFKNGVVYATQTYTNRLHGGGITSSITQIIYLNAGDYIEIFGFHNAGTDLFVYQNSGVSGQLTYLNITRLPSSQALAQSEQVMGYVYKTSSQSIPNNISTVLTDFIKDQDTHNAMNATSGIITAPKSGYLTLNAGALFAASSSGDIREIQVQVNSTIVARSAVARRSDNTAHATISITGIRVNSGDQITVRVLQNSGAALNITGTSDRYNFISWKIE